MLAQRVASAAVGIPLILALVYVGGAWYVAIAAVALAVAALEFQHLRHEWSDAICLLTALVVGGIAVGAYGDTPQWLAWLGGAALAAALASVVQADAEERAADVLWSLGGVTYVGFLGSFIVLLRTIDFDGRAWVYLTVLSTFAVDTASYFTGRAVGRRLLAPAISPRKTVEGFLGGWIGGFAAVVALARIFDLGVDASQIVLLAIALPPVAATGDLIESSIKRLAGAKDASELIPGHGGVLDRLDSLLFTFALVYLFTQFVVY